MFRKLFSWTGMADEFREYREQEPETKTVTVQPNKSVEIECGNLRIVNHNEGTGLLSTRGTNIYLDGKELKHVTRIQLDWRVDHVAAITVTQLVQRNSFPYCDENVIESDN